MSTYTPPEAGRMSGRFGGGPSLVLRRALAYVVRFADRLRKANARLQLAKTARQKQRALCAIEACSERYQHYRRRVGLICQDIQTDADARSHRCHSASALALVRAAPVVLDVGAVKAGSPDPDAAMERLLKHARPCVAGLVRSASRQLHDLSLQEIWAYADEGVLKAVIGGDTEDAMSWVPRYDGAPNSAAFTTYAYKRVMRELQVRRTVGARPIDAVSLDAVTTEDGQSAAESLHAVPVSSQGVIQSVAAATADSCRKTLAVIAVREALARLDSDQDREIAEAIYVEGESVRAAAEKLGMTKSELSVRLAEIHEFLATALADFQEEL